MSSFRINSSTNLLNSSSISVQTISSILDEKSNVKIYGAKGDGINDDTNAIISAVQNSNSLYFPEGVYRITSQIDINKSNFSIIGKNATILTDTLTNSSAFNIQSIFNTFTVSITAPLDVGATSLTVDDASSVQKGDWVLLENSQQWFWTDGDWITRNSIVEVLAASATTITLYTPVLLPMTLPITATVYRPVSNVYINGIHFVSSSVIPSPLPSFQNPRAIQLYNTVDVQVQNCKFDNFFGSAIAIDYSIRTTVLECIFNGAPETYIPDYSTNQNMGYKAVSCDTCLYVNVVNCEAFQCLHLLDGNSLVYARINDCDSAGHLKSMIYLYGGSACSTITNNTCSSPFGTAIRNDGWTIQLLSNNHFIMSENELDAIVADMEGILAAPAEATNSLNDTCSIAHNIIDTSSPMSTKSFILGNYYESLTITGNICKKATIAFSIRSLYVNGCSIVNNTLDCTPSDPTYDAIRFEETPELLLRDNITITDNTITGYGRSGIRIHASPNVSRKTNVISITQNILDSTSTSHNLSAIVITNPGYYGNAIMVKNNMVIGTMGNQTNSFPTSTTIERIPVNEMIFTGLDKTIFTTNIIAYQNSTTLPVQTTIERASVIMNTQPVLGGTYGWICTVSGTVGTLSGITATVTNEDPNTLTLSGSNLNLVSRGMYITVNSISVRVLTMVDTFTTITVDSPITPAGAYSVAYRNPTWVPFGIIANRITNVYAVNADATDERASTTSVSSMTLPQVASKLSNLISDLRTAGYLA